MKKQLSLNIILVLCTFFTLHVSAQDGPSMKFMETEYDFGTVEQGDVVEHTFKFENTGKEPLIISDVRTTCGCTVPEWPQNPITPGSKEEIHVRFNTAGKMGSQNKVVTIISNNAGGNDKVVVKGTVVKKNTEEKK